MSLIWCRKCANVQAQSPPLPGGLGRRRVRYIVQYHTGMLCWKCDHVTTHSHFPFPAVCLPCLLCRLPRLPMGMDSLAVAAANARKQASAMPIGMRERLQTTKKRARPASSPPRRVLSLPLPPPSLFFHPVHSTFVYPAALLWSGNMSSRRPCQSRSKSSS